MKPKLDVATKHVWSDKLGNFSFVAYVAAAVSALCMPAGPGRFMQQLLPSSMSARCDFIRISAERSLPGNLWTLEIVRVNGTVSPP